MKNRERRMRNHSRGTGISVGRRMKWKDVGKQSSNEKTSISMKRMSTKKNSISKKMSMDSISKKMIMDIISKKMILKTSMSKKRMSIGNKMKEKKEKGVGISEEGREVVVVSREGRERARSKRKREAKGTAGTADKESPAKKRKRGGWMIQR